MHQKKLISFCNFLIAFGLFLSTLDAQENYKYLILIKYYEAPVKNKVWEIALYNKNDEYYLQNIELNFDVYKIKLRKQEFDVYKQRIDGLIQKSQKSQYSIPFDHSFYKIYYLSGKNNDVYYLNDSEDYSLMNSYLYELVRYLKNIIKIKDPNEF
jgi:hypothetical protein